jgi:hypothetical protein
MDQKPFCNLDSLSTATTSSATTSSSTHNYNGVNINIGFLKSVPGYLKFAELVSYILIEEKEAAINAC